MKVERLSFQKFRNLREGEIHPDPETNVIYGANAQGKTQSARGRLAVYGGKSFRGARDAELVAFGGGKRFPCPLISFRGTGADGPPVFCRRTARGRAQRRA